MLAGVAVVGVQALNETLQQEIKAREAEIAELKRRLSALEGREARLRVLEMTVERLLTLIPPAAATTVALD
jgi:hypothetical protein